MYALVPLAHAISHRTPETDLDNPVTVEDVDCIKNDWLTDNVLSPLVLCLTPMDSTNAYYRP